jgi:hypothetical protein
LYQVPKTLTFVFAGRRNLTCALIRCSGLASPRRRLACPSAPTTEAAHHPAFPYAAAYDVYHSFPALFCAGDSRIVERSFVTCFRRGEIAM